MLLLTLLAGTTTARAQNNDRGRFLRWAYQDAGALATDHDRRDIFIAAGAIGIMAGVTLLDPSIAHEVGEGYGNRTFAGYVDAMNYLGGPLASIPVAALFGASLATRSHRFQDAAFTSFQSLIYSGALNYALKYAVGRIRPEDRDSQYRFRPFSGNTSFPSGHTNAAFAIVMPWALYYPHPVTYTLAVGAGTGTALARISRDKHWASDVIAGALEGSLMAWFLVRRHQRESRSARSAARIFIRPGMTRGGGALVLLARM